MLTLYLLSVLALTGFGTCQNGVPTFEWVQDEVSPDGVPLLSINFHDGRKNDVAILKHFNPIPKGKNERDEDIDNCIFDGFLCDENKVYITLTGGCPFENSFDIQFRSERAVEHMFRVKNGRVEPVISTYRKNKGYPFLIGLKAHNESRKLKRSNKHPNGLSLAVKIHYDQTFKSEFGDDSLNVVRRVVAQAQNIYYWPTLPSIVTLNVVAEEEIPDYITADGPSLELVGLKYANDPNINSFFFLCNRDDSTPAAGYGYVNTVCDSYLRSRIAISEYYNDDLESAEYMAHEFGHNLGMEHDFLCCPTEDRYDSQGQTCTNIHGVMDYDRRDKWTTCSYEDFSAADHTCLPEN